MSSAAVRSRPQREAGFISIKFIPGFAQRLFQPVFPRHAVSIASEYVACVRVGKTPAHSVESAAVAPLAAGVVAPSHSKPNISDREAVQRALSEAVQRAGLFRKEVNLLLPDAAARVFLIPLETLPGKSAELVQLLRFKVKKSLPFSVEEAALCYQIQTLSPTHYEIILSVMDRGILREYESVVEAVGLEPGYVTVEHFGVAQLMDRQVRDWRAHATLLFRVAPHMFTTSIYDQGQLRFYRSVEKEVSSGQIAALTPEGLFDEIYPSLAYFQDKYEHAIEKIYFSGLPAGSESICAAIQKMAECPAAEIRVERTVGALNVSADQMSQVFAPLIGIELGAV